MFMQELKVYVGCFSSNTSGFQINKVLRARIFSKLSAENVLPKSLKMDMSKSALKMPSFLGIPQIGISQSLTSIPHSNILWTNKVKLDLSKCGSSRSFTT